MERRAVVGVIVAVTLTVAASCGSSGGGADESADGPPVVVATTSIWADVVGNVACDGLVEVETLVPVGADAHSFEPSLADREVIDGAVLVVANGLGLEESLHDTLEQAEADGTPLFEVGDHVATLDVQEEGHDEEGEGHEDEDGHDEDTHGEEGEGHEHEEGHDEEGEGHEDEESHDEEGHQHEGSTDPHVWFDPIRVSDALDALADALVTDGGLDREAVDACVAEYREALTEADRQIEEALAAIPDEQRVLVTNHESLGYFADRYGFEVLGAVIPSTSTLAASNPADLAELAAAIDAAGVPAVFGETSLSDDDLQALAEEVGAQVVALYTESLGEPGSGADTYVGLLVTDAGLIAGGLTGAG